MSNQLYVENTSECKIKGENFYSTCKAPQQITVILPAFNEEVSIGSIVLLTKLYVDKVIVIDDGSSDRTSEIAKKAGAEVIVHEKNSGKGTALKTGFEAAVKTGADVIVTMDSDAQHNPSEIPKLAAPIIKGEADIVNGSRYINGSDKNTPAYRRLGQKILDRVTTINSGIKITDSQSGFRAFSASTVGVFRFNTCGMAIESEMLADAGKAGLQIKEVSIGVRYDVNGSTKKPMEHGLEVLIAILRDVEINHPLFYFTAPGMFLGIIGLYMGAYFLQTFIMGRGLNFGPTILMALFVITGSFMAFTGILLHSLSAIRRNKAY